MSTQVEPDSEILENVNNTDGNDFGSFRSNVELNPIVNTPISDSVVNYVPNQVIFSLVFLYTRQTAINDRF